MNGGPPHVRYIYEWLAPKPHTTSCIWNGELGQVPADGSGCPGGAGWRTTVAVTNGAAEGLFIIDLNTLLIADGSPFF